MFRPAALLFDLDDTLVDRRASIRAYAEVFHTIFADVLKPGEASSLVEPMIRADCGGYRSRQDVAATLVESLPWEQKPDCQILWRHWVRHFPDCTQPRDHAISVIRSLHDQGIIVGVVTNGSTIGQNRKIDAIGLRSFLSTFIISEAAGIKKPAPEIFHLALAEMRQPPSKAWFVGDHPLNDIVGSANVGLTPIWLRGMHDWPETCAAPAMQIECLSEIIALVAAAKPAP